MPYLLMLRHAGALCLCRAMQVPECVSAYASTYVKQRIAAQRHEIYSRYQALPTKFCKVPAVLSVFFETLV